MGGEMEKLKVLFLTCLYPPQKFPRSIQISHLVQYLRDDFFLTVITSEPDNTGDPSLLSFTSLDNVEYAEKSLPTKIFEKSKGYRIKKEILPDFQYLWHFDLYKKTRRIVESSGADVIVTFGQPMSTHIAGLKLKQQYPHIKWLAHFSDPWVDNIFNNYNVWTKWINKYYQDSVFKNADQLIFTSEETIDLVTKKYPKEIRSKSICVPHAFNQNLYGKTDSSFNKKLTIRYIGNFYGDRQPDSLFKALQRLTLHKKELFRVEIIGSSTSDLDLRIKLYSLENIVFLYPPVSYIDSLKLMQKADVLLIVDAATDISPFLPSKLIDYIGANKPILGITPPGASQKLLDEMNFLVADPRNISEISNKLAQIIKNFSRNRFEYIQPSIRDRYSISTVGEQIKSILKNL